MTLFTAVNPGDWHSPPTWDVGGGRYPGDGVDPAGDSVDIRGGHTVTFNGWQAGDLGYIGTDVIGNLAIAVPFTRVGGLVLNATLQYRGNITFYSESHVTLAAGAFLECNSPAGNQYDVRFRYAGASPSTLVFNGTRASPSGFKNIGTGNNFVRFYTEYDGAITGDHMQFEGMGTAGLYAFWVTDPSLSINLNSVLFKDSSRFHYESMDATTNLDIGTFDIRTPRGATVVDINATTNKDVAATRNIGSLTAYDSTQFLIATGNAPDLTFGEVIIPKGNIGGGVNSRRMTIGKGFFSLPDPTDQDSITPSTNAAHQISDVIFTALRNNPHYITEVTAYDQALTANQYSGLVYDGFGGLNDGDFLIAGGRITFDYCIGINNAGNCLTFLNTTAIAESWTHNTIHDCARANIGEGPLGGAAILENFQSNIYVDLDSGIYQLGAYVEQGAQFILNHNCYFNQTDAANIDHPVALQNSYVGAELRRHAIGAHGVDP